jgi:hypothetical protein
MIGHEIAGVLVATVVAVAFVTALQPNSQMANILGSASSGWAQILNSVRGSTYQAAA